MIGGAGDGILLLRDGAKGEAPKVTIAEQTDSTGLVGLYSGSELEGGMDWIVGKRGTGTVAVQDAGLELGGGTTMTLGAEPVSRGILTVQGANASVLDYFAHITRSAPNLLVVGENGVGQVTVSGGGEAVFDYLYVGRSPEDNVVEVTLDTRLNSHF